MVTAGAAHAFGVCTAKWLRAAARAPYFRYMAKQQNPIQRREVIPTHASSVASSG